MTQTTIADAADRLLNEYDQIHIWACKDIDCYRCYDIIAGPSEARHDRPRTTNRR